MSGLVWGEIALLWWRQWGRLAVSPSHTHVQLRWFLARIGITDARYDRGITFFGENGFLNDGAPLTLLQLETRFWGQSYLDLVLGGGFRGSKGVNPKSSEIRQFFFTWHYGRCVPRRHGNFPPVYVAVLFFSLNQFFGRGLKLPILKNLEEKTMVGAPL